jgi:hypothetical protein
MARSVGLQLHLLCGSVEVFFVVEDLLIGEQFSHVIDSEFRICTQYHTEMQAIEGVALIQHEPVTIKAPRMGMIISYFWKR